MAEQHQFEDDLPVVKSSKGTQRAGINRFLDVVGDGSGNKQGTGNYVTATPFMIKPADGEIFRISRMLVRIKTTGDLKDASYGFNTTLTNGIKVEREDNTGVLEDLTDGIPILLNQDWGRYCFDFDVGEKIGKNVGDVRWSFFKKGQQIRLVGAEGDRLQVVLHDDFSGGGFIDHLFFVQGYIEQALP